MTVQDDGTPASLVWGAADSQLPWSALAAEVHHRKVNGVFRTDAQVLGTPQKGGWTHLSLPTPSGIQNTSALLTAAQQIAAAAEEYQMLWRTLQIYTEPQLELALRLLQSETLYRSEKVVGPAEWLLRLHRSVMGTPSGLRGNLVWRAVANAPAGFCHTRSSMLGTLLYDIGEGMTYEKASRRFCEKMNPTQYQRPQAAPTEANVLQAEHTIQKLGLAASLRRRYARLDEIQTIWRPTIRPQASTETSGVFGHLRTRPSPAARISMQIPPVLMTWEKFHSTVLPRAQQIQMELSDVRNSFCALVTAVDPEAPPILQWDTPARRNPFSWYLWDHGVAPKMFNLVPGKVEVMAVTRLPPNWYADRSTHHGDAAILVLRDCRDVTIKLDPDKRIGLGLFPEILKSDLHHVRATLEAHSRSQTLEGAEEASACGIMLSRDGFRRPTVLRVSIDGVESSYSIDRWS